MTEFTAGAGSMAALSFGELLQWNDETFTRWEQLISANPSILDLPCDIYNTTDVRGLVIHNVAVELRYAERLGREEITPYDAIGGDSVEAIFSHHRRAVEKFRALIGSEDAEAWSEMLEFTTLSRGVMQASRRKIYVHSMMHGIRHFAQLATLVRQHGIQPGWGMDFMGSSAMK